MKWWVSSRTHGHVTRGWLGVEHPERDAGNRLLAGPQGAKGAMVAEVVPGGPASKAGFEQGDIVTAIDGQAVDEFRDLTRRVAGAAGASATFTVSRQGKPQQLKAISAAGPTTRWPPTLPDRAGSVPASASAMGLGLASADRRTRADL